MQNIVTPQYPSQQQDFTLDNFRLPPGITLTRVQGSHSPVHPELPMRMVDRTKRENSYSSTNTSSPGPNPIIVTSPLSAPKTKESLGKFFFLFLNSTTNLMGKKNVYFNFRFSRGTCGTKRHCG
jgi:hypothetical protein